MPHVLLQEGRKHVDVLAAHGAPDDLLEGEILSHLGDDAPVVPEGMAKHGLTLRPSKLCDGFEHSVNDNTCYQYLASGKMRLPLVLPKVLGQLLTHSLVEAQQRQRAADAGGRGGRDGLRSRSSLAALGGGGGQTMRAGPPLAFAGRTLLRCRLALCDDVAVPVLNVAVLQREVTTVLQSPVVEAPGAVFFVLRRLGAGERRRRRALLHGRTQGLEVVWFRLDR